MTFDPVKALEVSSLYGRVYRELNMQALLRKCFLPIREGVSWTSFTSMTKVAFPPYTGGCIGYRTYQYYRDRVSSLYGRVYRTSQRGKRVL